MRWKERIFGKIDVPFSSGYLKDILWKDYISNFKKLYFIEDFIKEIIFQKLYFGFLESFIIQRNNENNYTSIILVFYIYISLENIFVFYF